MNILENIDYKSWYEQMEASVKVRAAEDCLEELIQEMRNPVEQVDIVLPWEKLQDKFLYRPGEVTVLAGQNGSGKSLIAGQIAIHLISQNQKVVIASFEMKPARTLQRMIRQWSRMSFPTLQAHEQFKEWVKDRLWFYDQQGTVSPSQVLGVGVYAKTILGCQHYFIDSLMKCTRGETDYDSQKDFTDQLCSLARDQNSHVHLVHHIRKQSDDNKTPSKNDLKGSGSVADQVDNVILMHRNKSKERDFEAHGFVDHSIPDAFLSFEKQRNGEWEGVAKLWFDKKSQQYVQDCGGLPTDYQPKATAHQ